MKLSVSVALLVPLLSTADAWIAVPLQPKSLTASPTRSTSDSTRLSAHKLAAWSVGAAAAVTGWALATQIASASVATTSPAPIDMMNSMALNDSAPSTMLAAGAYVPEDSYMSLDMSMPKYDTGGADVIISAPGSKVAGAAGGGKSSSATVKVTPKAGEDPEQALGRVKKEAEKRVAQEQKRQATMAKMEAKKAERAAIQGKKE